jgi:enoyl-CoA hydratase
MMSDFDETVTADDVEAFDFKHLKLTFDDEGVAWVTIDRPKQLNALNTEVVEELRVAVSDLIDDPETEAIVITGGGDKAFVAGADIAELAELSAHEARGLSLNGQDVLATIENCPKPVIAMINGFALGGGLELALACHLRVAATTAKLGLPEVSLGLIPGFAGTVRLARLAGPGVAREWILTGDQYGAEEAHRVGVVTRVAPPERLREEVQKLCATIMKRSPLAVAAALETIRRGQEVGQTEAENLEADAFGMMFTTDDAREGTQAFLEKRKPNF